MSEQTRDGVPFRPCAVCALPTQWEVWAQAICPEHWRAWQAHEPRIDDPALTGAQVEQRSRAWVAWMAKKTPQVEAPAKVDSRYWVKPL